MWFDAKEEHGGFQNNGDDKGDDICCVSYILLSTTGEATEYQAAFYDRKLLPHALQLPST